MVYKELAKTGILISEIGLGTWQYHGGIEPLLAGIGLGVNFIDTAESYGTEEIVGQAIRDIRDKVILATKVSPRHFRRPDIIQAAEQSLKRLNTDYIDLYQLHWPNYNVPIGETMAAMEDLVQAGKIRFIGVSNFSKGEVEKAQATLSRYRIVSNQVRYSLVERTIEDGLMQYCEANHVTILAFSPLARGLQNVRRYDPSDVVATVAQATGRTPAQVALNWCTCHSAVVAIFKADNVGHVTENCAGSGWRLQPDQLKALNRLHCQRRGSIERFARRLGRRAVQKFGRSI